jgi:phage repressor protein C with HTH and peptisase S24 domain
MQTWNERLRYAINKRGVTATDLARACGIKPASVSGWTSGDTKTMEAGNALRVSEYLQINLPWLLLNHPPSGLESDDQKGAFLAEQNIAGYSSKSIDVPLMNAKASMGNGNTAPDEEVVIDVLRLSKSWMHNNLPTITSITNIAFIHAIGDSMTPTFNDGDILLVDVGIKEVKSDAIYVLEALDRLFIKRVRQRLDGQYEISSDNPNVKTVDILNGDNQVSIRGRVVWLWNGKRL